MTLSTPQRERESVFHIPQIPYSSSINNDRYRLDHFRSLSSPSESSPDTIFSPPLFLEEPSSPASSIIDTPTRKGLSNSREEIFSDKPSARGSSLSRPLQSRSKRYFTSGSPCPPDRFIPNRGACHVDSSVFHITQEPQRLSRNERCFRKRDPLANPFSPLGGQQGRRDVIRHDELIPQGSFPHYSPRYVLDESLLPYPPHISRQLLLRATWRLEGTISPRVVSPNAVPDRNGNLVGSGTGAPMYLASFLATDTSLRNRRKHEARLALALGFDQANRILPLHDNNPVPRGLSTFPWLGMMETDYQLALKCRKLPPPVHVPLSPFRVLDAPLLKNDFYCSPLAYSRTTNTLAVALGDCVFTWSEQEGAVQIPLYPEHPSPVISLSFSSEDGGNSILAIGRQRGDISFWSSLEGDVRFELNLPFPISCLSFKQLTSRPSAASELLMSYEELVIGDDLGYIWYYSVAWPDPKSRARTGWKGEATLIAKISAHSQQICGLTWSPDGIHLASGGNDNACHLYDIVNVLKDAKIRHLVTTQYNRKNHPPTFSSALIDDQIRSKYNPLSVSKTLYVPANRQKHTFPHGAAVKAMAFAPWEPSLLATGGGLNDRCIHFFHITTGACLATINVHAQVTSLIWSTTRREIAATFGFAQPDHPFRIAVFSWPRCEQVSAIAWTSNSNDTNGQDSNSSPDCGRALWAISYPGGPGYVNETMEEDYLTEDFDPIQQEFEDDPNAILRPKRNRPLPSRTAEEGCIVVASSNERISFYEVWRGKPGSVEAQAGLLGGSAILETVQGICPEDEIIR